MKYCRFDNCNCNTKECPAYEETRSLTAYEKACQLSAGINDEDARKWCTYYNMTAATAKGKQNGVIGDSYYFDNVTDKNYVDLTTDDFGKFNERGEWTSGLSDRAKKMLEERDENPCGNK